MRCAAPPSLWRRPQPASGVPCSPEHVLRSCNALHGHPFIYMRLKETFFITSAEDSGLTIAGCAADTLLPWFLRLPSTREASSSGSGLAHANES